MLFRSECIKRFSLSAKNPRYVTSLNEWTYSAAVGPYGGYAMKQRDRTVFENSELAEMKKDEIRELIENEKSRKISNFLGGEILKLPKSASKESMIDKISKHFELSEKDRKKIEFLRKTAPGYIGPKFAKKASDADILVMADLQDQKARIYNRYVKVVDDAITKLHKKYRINQGKSIDITGFSEYILYS